MQSYSPKLAKIMIFFFHLQHYSLEVLLGLTFRNIKRHTAQYHYFPSKQDPVNFLGEIINLEIKQDSVCLANGSCGNK